MKSNKFKTYIGVLSGLSALCLSACAQIGETHLFATYDKTNGDIVNVFRLTVSGSSDFSNSKYLAGYYDEKAVDLFFNEISGDAYLANTVEGINGASAATGSLANGRKFFEDCNPEAPTSGCDKFGIKSLGGDPAKTVNKAFVLLLSTDASAIAETIGAIAEDTTNKQTLYRMANKDKLQERAQLAATQSARLSKVSAVKAELNAIMSASDKTEADYLIALSAIARALSNSAPSRFENWATAKTWFDNYSKFQG